MEIQPTNADTIYIRLVDLFAHFSSIPEEHNESTTSLHVDIIQGSLGFCIPRCGFWILGTGFFVSGTWIPDSEALDYRLQKQNFPDSGKIRITW